MANHKRALTDQEREQRRAEQRELVRASVEQLRSSDGWRAWMRARSRFRAYSTLILRASCPRCALAADARW